MLEYIRHLQIYLFCLSAQKNSLIGFSCLLAKRIWPFFLPSPLSKKDCYSWWTLFWTICHEKKFSCLMLDRTLHLVHIYLILLMVCSLLSLGHALSILKELCCSFIYPQSPMTPWFVIHFFKLVLRLLSKVVGSQILFLLPY